MTPSLLVPALLALGAAGEPAPAAEFPLAIRAAHVHIGDGAVLEDAVVLVEGGKIRAVGKDVEIPAGAAVLEHEGHLTPGLIALHDYAGLSGESVDATRAALAEADVALGRRTDHPDVERARQAGITTLLLAPNPTALVSGTTAAVKTGDGSVLRAPAHLALSLSALALRPDRAPTSYAGALEQLDELLRSSSGPLAAAARGELPVLISARDRHEVARACRFAKTHGLRGAILGGDRASEVKEALLEAGLGLVAGPFDPGTERRELRSVVELVEAGVPVGFALDTPARHPAALRLQAALIVREGLDPAAALKMLTVDAARLAGVSERVGTIAVGKDADLVLWGGAPLDLGSAVWAVFVDGERVHGGDL